MKVGFAGAGNMAAAIARGWAASDAGPERMLFCDLDRARAAALAAEVGGETRESLTGIRDDTDVVLLAVKPAALDDVAAELERRAPALISILAATPLARIADAFPGVPVIRVMPNQPVAVNRGVLCCAPAPPGVPDAVARELVSLLEPLGEVVELPEDRLDAAMAVMSCSPAYVALFAEALAEAGTREGLDPTVAAELVAATLAGTATMLGSHAPEAIRRAVAPPGGATEAGLEALGRAGFTRAIDDAVEASLERFR
ncbi:MAG TPA: pyrroline-5-carboxylate reductase [Solirubrobacterales bacterium]|nr:pyrroline-5-carboxylate reductase [Solirubrobacterales bacterium]